MFLVLHVPDFALQAVLRTEAPAATAAAPLYRSAPAALFTGTTKKSVASAVNALAAAAGVAPGMTAPQAVARCPHLLIRAPHADPAADAHAALCAVAFTVSAAVEATLPGVCTLDLHGRPRVALATVTRAALDRLGALGLCATAGVARTPLLALYAARAATLADGVHLVGDEKAFLAPLPLATAEPEPELAEVLHNWGIGTLGALTALSRDAVGRRLGAAGAALWDRAQGGEPRPLHLLAPPQSFAAAMDFEDELETLEPLLFILRRFLDRLTLELEAAGFVAVDLELTLRLTDEKEHRRSFRLPEPTRDAAILFRALHTHLESLRTDAPIAAVALRLTPARPLVRQHGLFDTGLRDPHGFAETLARVVAVVGSDRVGTPQPEDSHRPDAVKLVPPLAVVPPPAPAAVHPVLGLPLRRFRPPRPAKLELTDGEPTYLWAEGIEGAISARRGPWASSGEWWQGDRAWRRLEWDIALAGGGLYRLFRAAEGWFLEGEYD